MKLSQEICKHPKFTIKRGMRYRYIVDGEPKTKWNTARSEVDSWNAEIDLTDGATVGALLYLLRELTGVQWGTLFSGGRWICEFGGEGYGGGYDHAGAIEGEAVARAFLAEVSAGMASSNRQLMRSDLVSGETFIYGGLGLREYRTAVKLVGNDYPVTRVIVTETDTEYSVKIDPDQSPKHEQPSRNE